MQADARVDDHHPPPCRIWAKLVGVPEIVGDAGRGVCVW